MNRKTLKFSCPEEYSLKTLCLTHGWRQLRPFSGMEGPRRWTMCSIPEHNPWTFG